MNDKLTYLGLINCVKSLYLLKAYIIRFGYVLYTAYQIFNRAFYVIVLFGYEFFRGLSMQVEVKGKKVRWLTPHPLHQVSTDDIDYI